MSKSKVRIGLDNHVEAVDFQDAELFLVRDLEGSNEEEHPGLYMYLNGEYIHLTGGKGSFDNTETFLEVDNLRVTKNFIDKSSYYQNATGVNGELWVAPAAKVMRAEKLDANNNPVERLDPRPY